MPLLRSKKTARVSISSDSAETPLELRPSTSATTTATSSNVISAQPSRLDIQTPIKPSLLTTSALEPPTPADAPRLVITDEHCESPTAVADPAPSSIEAAMSEALQEPESTPEQVRESRRSHRESIVHRVTERLASPHAETRKKSGRSRRASTSSAISQGHSIAAALAKGNLQVGVGTSQDDALPRSSPTGRAVSTGRSPYLLSQGYDSDDEGYGSEDESEICSDDEGLSHLPVTGFAVASNRRNAEFHALFTTVDEGDYLIEDYGCALAKDILVHGRLYVSENHICFHSNLFGWVTDVVIAFADVKEIEKKMTALVIPNAIGVTTNKEKYTFASLISRDSTYDVLMNVWRIAHPGAEMQTSVANGSLSRPQSAADVREGNASGTDKSHETTECACGKAGKHYAELALDATFPSSPEKVYNLMFNSGWFRSFLTDSQKLRDIESSDWRPDEQQNLSRSTSYVKPLNGSIGPKQTKCHITDVQEHCEFDDYISLITTTRTPDVPSGGVFSVKTRTCFTWVKPASTRVVVTTEVEWTGKSWVKGIIEKSAIEGQKQYHLDLAKEMRAYMKEHPTEFGGAGEEGEQAAEQGSTLAASTPTEAQEYAAQNRRARQDADYWQLQGAFDSVVTGFTSIASGITTACDTISDLLSDSPISKASLIALVIAILLASNIYTYIARPASKHREKRLQRLGPYDEEVAEAVRIILDRRAATTPRDEIDQLLRLLNEVESRSKALRTSLEKASSDDDFSSGRALD